MDVLHSATHGGQPLLRVGLACQDVLVAKDEIRKAANHCRHHCRRLAERHVPDDSRKRNQQRRQRYSESQRRSCNSSVSSFEQETTPK